ncbi:hypothetical protein OEZ86_003165 [Tetradesmus obliquus]|nr:hypothetical protein OEZ86_003165 [Tetradesmus obliquus]
MRKVENSKWIETYEAERGNRNDLEQQQLLCSSYCICLLLRFYDLNNVGDRARLATVCRALMSAATAGTCALLSDAAAAAAAAAVPSASSAGPSSQQLALFRSYSAALSFTHIEDFYADAAPLVPLAQLYDAAKPSAGLVMLLKAAVWQVLWCEPSSASSASASPQQRQQQLLRRSLGELGGLLLCQLHDRNCVREFCPPAAFLAEALPPGRLLQEVAARGGIEALAGNAGNDSSDDDAEHATPLEQQQQWQRQRQRAFAGAGEAAGMETEEQQQQQQRHAQPGTGAAAAGTSSAAAGAGRQPGRGGGGSESEESDDDVGMLPAAGAAVAAGDPVAVGGFGFGTGTTAQQQRRQGTLGAAAAAAFGAGGGGGGSTSAAGSRVWLVLQHAPCLIPFQDRVQLFQAVVSEEKEVAAAAAASAAGAGGMFTFDDPMSMFMGGAAENRFVTIRRDQLLEDSFAQLNSMGADRLKGRLRIAYVNEAGLAEAGIDGGGLFKDFMEELLRQGFSPQSHLFCENPQRQLYPNPAAHQLLPDAEGQLRFLGRMLGKSLYEGVLLELPLAAFFLKKMRGGVCDINDLPSLDPEVYKHLAQLKHYSGDFADLSLTFTATVVDATPEQQQQQQASTSAAPRTREVDLKAGGRDIPVRADNVVEYIHRLADFRLNRQMDRAANAFLGGFFELIRPRWVRMFNEAELQMLISGSEEGIDVDDLVAHVNYAGGYHAEHPVMLTLWDALRTFSPQQQRLFLKFVTSCSRAPLLGFRYLEPQLCIQMSGSVLAAGSRERLPTAATCMNLLKLPPYQDFDEMRSKLLYAITAGAGFELS